MAATEAERSTPSSVGAVGRWWYRGELADFRHQSPEHILGVLAAASGGSIDSTQRDAWIAQILLLKCKRPVNPPSIA
jgi:hypothetical protein